MNFRRSLAVALTLSLLAPTMTLIAPGTAFAQAKRKPLREQLTEDAKKHWDTALDFYKHSNWDGARTSFNAAYDASKNPRVLFNVAVCEKNMTRYARAIETFKRELAEGKGLLQPDEEAEIRQQITGLEQFVAALTIDVSEPGADVFVDDQKVGTSPLPGPVNVQLGERRVRASKSGFGEAVESIELKGGSTGHVALKLSANVKTGRVNISVIGPKSADVRVDGRIVGSAPYSGQVTIAAEPHQFSAEAPGFVTATQAATVREGETLNLTIQMSADQEKGKLAIVASPIGATIEIDGKVRGASRWDGPVETGSHQIVVKKQGYYTRSYDIEVPRGGERSVTAALDEDHNNSFVPWLIGTVLVVGAAATAMYFIVKPRDEDPTRGTLPPYTVPTPTPARF